MFFRDFNVRAFYLRFIRNDGCEKQTFPTALSVSTALGTTPRLQLNLNANMSIRYLTLEDLNYFLFERSVYERIVHYVVYKMYTNICLDDY